jgi:hypothetical protein
MKDIKFIPARGKNTSEGAYWKQTDACAGLDVSDDCPFRYEEMELVTYTPQGNAPSHYIIK